MPSKGKGKGISGAREAWRALRRGERNPAWNYCVLLPSLFFISIHQRNVKILFGQPITLVLVFQRAQLRTIKATGDVCAQAATWWISSPPGEALIGFSNLCRLIRSLQSFVSPLLFFNRGSVSLTEVKLYKSGAIYLLFTLQLFKSWIALSTG